MTTGGLEALQARLARVETGGRIGRIARVSASSLTIEGLSGARLGDRIDIMGASGVLNAEIVGMEGDKALALPDGRPAGIAPGDRVRHCGPAVLAPDDSWIGRIIDPDGQPLDGRPLMQGPNLRPYAGPPPTAATRRALGDRMETGLAAFNTFLPLVQGQRMGLFAGSGVGKSTLLGLLAKQTKADVVVIGLIGERGRELRQFTESVLGKEGLEKAVIVTATSDRPALSRRRCAQACLTVAEHFRDNGRHVLLLADSITRFAEAHRDVALAAGETAGPSGYPPSMGQAVMELCERAGPGAPGQGDISAIFTVLAAASDMEGPVADTLRGTLDGHVVLDRVIAERGRYPAIDLLRSVSRSLPEAASDAENGLLARARRLLGVYERAELMIQAGLYVQGADAEIDEAILRRPAIEAFLGNTTVQSIAESYAALAKALDGEDQE
ncbi:MAG: FliI/YscN family ATPase [Qingshengfaniella sp.]